MLTRERIKARSALASAEAEAKRRPDDPTLAAKVDELRRQYRTVAAEDYIKQLVDTFPPLSESQRSRLAVLLLSGGGVAA